MDKAELGAAAVKEIFHHGVKGMKWGVRKSRTTRTPTEITVKEKVGKKKLGAEGGKNLPATKEALSARATTQVIRKSGVKALTNEQLQAYNNRLNLEQNAQRLEYNTKSQAGRFVAGMLGNIGKQQAQNVGNEYASRQIKKRLFKTGVKAAAVAAV